jgi:DNA-binding CsgD family transcriptional regulator
MAISKDFLWGTIEQLTDELERADPQSLIGARVRGLLDAKQLSLHTTDRHNQPKQSYRSHDDECVRRYLSGKSTWTIAAELGINAGTVSAALKRCGVKARHGQKAQASTRRQKDTAKVDRIRELRAEGQNLSDIGIALHISRERVRQICVREGISTERILTADQNTAVEEYLAGDSLLQIAERRNVHPGTVRSWVLASGNSIRAKGFAERRLSPKTISNSERAAQLYQEGQRVQTIADELGVPQPNVYRLLAIAGVKPNRGAFNRQVSA